MHRRDINISTYLHPHLIPSQVFFKINTLHKKPGTNRQKTLYCISFPSYKLTECITNF